MVKRLRLRSSLDRQLFVSGQRKTKRVVGFALRKHAILFVVSARDLHSSDARSATLGRFACAGLPHADAETFVIVKSSEVFVQWLEF